MSYKPTEARYKGRGRYYYIRYENLEKTRAGTRVWKPRVKRVYISGDLISHKLGNFRVRTGKMVHGMLFVYRNTRGAYRRRKPKSRGKVHIGRTEMRVEKVVELPKSVRDVRVFTSKRAVQPTLVEVA